MLDGLEEVPHGFMVGSTAAPNPPNHSAFVPNHLRSHQREDDFEDDELKVPFRTANPFDDPPDSDGEQSVSDSEPNQTPQSYQIRTGSRRGLLSRGYSSEESLEPGSMLSVIPEESTLEVQMAESHDLIQQSYDLLKQSHDSQTKPLNQQFSGQEDMELPWYQDVSQDVWQTTPAYHREEVWPDEGAKVKEKRPDVHKLVVTEEIKPVLQVRQSISIVCSQHHSHTHNS